MTTENWDDAQEVNAQTTETWDRNANTPLIGKYIGTDLNVGPNDSQMHKFIDDNGDTIGAWGSTLLDDKMKEVLIGSRVRIVSLGKKTSPKTGRSFYDYEVKVKPPTAAAQAQNVVAASEPVETPLELAEIPFGE